MSKCDKISRPPYLGIANFKTVFIQKLKKRRDNGIY